MEFDFEFRIKRTRHRFIDITCHECGSIFKVGIPNHLKEEAQYGPMIKTYICLLSKVGIVSVNRIKKIRLCCNNVLIISLFILRGRKRQALLLIKPENFLPVSNYPLTY